MDTKCRIDLMNLIQGDKTTDEYEQEFNQLFQFAPDVYKDSEEKKKQFFMAGLEPYFQRRLIEFEFPDFATLVEKARSLEYEGKYEIEQYRKRKQTSEQVTYDSLETSSMSKRVKHSKSSRKEKIIRTLKKSKLNC